MTPSVVISYDGTPDDDDAVALGRIFLQAGASVSLAYVRHSRLQDEAAEAREHTATDALLAHGAQALGPETRTQVLFNPSTASALRTLIVHEGGDILVFGSSYRTAAGHVAPGRAAEELLDRGPAAVALAPAGLRDADSELARGPPWCPVDKVTQPSSRSSRACLATRRPPGARLPQRRLRVAGGGDGLSRTGDRQRLTARVRRTEQSGHAVHSGRDRGKHSVTTTPAASIAANPDLGRFVDTRRSMLDARETNHTHVRAVGLCVTTRGKP
jgi:hypothetical protein